MGDRDFLHEMSERGFSVEEISDAAASGAPNGCPRRVPQALSRDARPRQRFV